MRINFASRLNSYHSSLTKILPERVGKKTEMLARFSTVAGEAGAADAERDVRGFALEFYSEEGSGDMVGNNTPVLFVRDPYTSRYTMSRWNEA